jgi:hypothetical protein
MGKINHVSNGISYSEMANDLRVLVRCSEGPRKKMWHRKSGFGFVPVQELGSRHHTGQNSHTNLQCTRESSIFSLEKGPRYRMEESYSLSKQKPSKHPLH